MIDALRAAAWTAVFTFVALFAGELAGVFGQVASWAAGGQPPDLSTVGAAAAAAAAAAGTAAVNFLYRALQARGVPLPGQQPRYQPAGGTDSSGGDPFSGESLAATR